jgi:hypothetical protein
MADENDIALGVMEIALTNANRICTFDQARAEIPSYVALSADNLAPSLTRAGEPMWHQLVRNIQSHHESEGNFIADGYLEHVPDTGYRITDAGIAYLKSKGLHA